MKAKLFQNLFYNIMNAFSDIDKRFVEKILSNTEIVFDEREIIEIFIECI